MQKNIILSQKSYPNEKVLLWSLTTQLVENSIESDNIPHIILPNIALSNQPVIAVILGQDYNPQTQVKDYTVYPDYVDALLEQGAYPVFIAYNKVEQQLDAIKPDAILLLGGNFSLRPSLTKGFEQRSLANLRMINYAQSHKMPLFAICGGEQILGVRFGAEICLNINENRAINHLQKPYIMAHKVELASGSIIKKILRKDEILTNSCHKTAIAVDASNPYIRATAVSEDGIVEAIEPRNSWNPFVLGVEWHPERLLKIDDADSKKLFGAFVDAARQYAKSTF